MLGTINQLNLVSRTPSSSSRSFSLLSLFFLSSSLSFKEWEDLFHPNTLIRKIFRKRKEEEPLIASASRLSKITFSKNLFLSLAFSRKRSRKKSMKKCEKKVKKYVLKMYSNTSLTEWKHLHQHFESTFSANSFHSLSAFSQSNFHADPASCHPHIILFFLSFSFFLAFKNILIPLFRFQVFSLFSLSTELKREREENRSQSNRHELTFIHSSKVSE